MDGPDPEADAAVQAEVDAEAEPGDAADDRPPRSGIRRARRAGSLAGFDRPEPLHVLVRGWRWSGWLVAGVVLLRLLAVAGLRLYLYVDSGEYDRIDFSGDWRRPWATPYLYWLIPGTDRATVVGQALVGAVCWATLALSAAAWFRVRTMRWVVAGTIAALGCTTVVTNWDAAKLSESLGLSLTVLVIAAWLNFLRRTDVATGLLLLLATWPWLFVRQSLLSAAWLIVLVAGAGALVAWRRARAAERSPVPARLLALVVAVLALETVMATMSYSHNQEVVQENLRVIVANRVAPQPARLAWFRNHGMPMPASGQLTPDALRSDLGFQKWVEGEGRSTYLEFLVTHPWYTATEPLDDFARIDGSSAEEPVPQSSMLAPGDTYASVRPVLPTVLQDVLFEPGGTGTAIAGLLVVSGWSLARRRRRSARWIVPWALVGISIASLYTGWHGATPELGRLALLGAVSLRIGVLLQLAFLLEDELEVRRRSSQALDASAEPVDGSTLGAAPAS